MSPTETRLCAILQRKVGQVATYSDFASVISIKNGTTNLRVSISRLRRIHGLDIKSVRGVGYCMNQKQPKQIFTEIAKALGVAISEVMKNNLLPAERDKFVQALVESISGSGSSAATPRGFREPGNDKRARNESQASQAAY